MTVNLEVCIINPEAEGVAKWEFNLYYPDREEAQFKSGIIPVSQCCIPMNVTNGDWAVSLYDNAGNLIEWYPWGNLVIEADKYNFDCKTGALVPGKIATQFREFNIVPREIETPGQVDIVCILVEKVSGKAIKDAIIEFRDYTLDRPVFSRKTNSFGYMSQYWYPQAKSIWVGIHEYYVTYSGSDKYETTSSSLLTLEVKEKVEPVPGEIKIVRLSYA